MKRLLAVVALLVGSLAQGLALGQGGGLRPIRPEALPWMSPLNVPGARGAWYEGREDKPEPYLFRARLEAGVRLPPHTHPDVRAVTVLSGTLYVGFGERFDENGATALEAGEVLLVPAKTPHFVWTRSGPVDYQESGMGPTHTDLVGGTGKGKI